MVKNILLISILVLISHALGASQCQIKAHDNYGIIGDGLKKAKLSSLVKFSNCDKSILERFRSILVNVRGKINAQQVSDNFIGHEELTLTPDNINVYQAEDLISKKLKLRADQKLFDLKLIAANKVLFWSNSASVTLYCNDCQGPGNRYLTISFRNPITLVKIRYNLEATLKVKIKVLKATNTISILSRDEFRHNMKESFIYTDTPSNYFFDVDKLSFYRLNKNFPQGKALETVDLAAKYLVKIGSSTGVTFNSGTLKLTTKAIAKKAGKFGEVIDLYNPTTKKNIVGKVIGFNKVAVEL